MAVEHAMFTFDDLKVTSRDDRMTDRMTTKVLSSRPCIKCGETNKFIPTLQQIIIILCCAYTVLSIKVLFLTRNVTAV